MRYFVELAYKGKDYHGWQIQPQVITVQGEIQNALNKLLQSEIDITGAGRTDTGVHAQQMFAHFDHIDEIDGILLTHKLNAFLPDTINIKRIFNVKGDMHARFHAVKRSYEYHIYLGRDPFLLDTTWQLYNQQLDIKKMNEAANILLNYTNFKCFSKVKTDVHTYECHITEAKWVKNQHHLIFYITANRFLRNMVRAIVGTLHDVGLGKTSIDQFIEIIQSEDRNKAGASAPAKGLFLTKVVYPNL